MLILKAILLGLLEGATEFLPVSSTGHLIVGSEVLNYPEQSRATFEIFIQLGAILAVVWHFRTPLRESVQGALTNTTDRGLLAKVLLAFVPAAVVGFLFHDLIEEYLFSPTAVAVSLIVGWALLSAVVPLLPWELGKLVARRRTVPPDGPGEHPSGGQP